MAATNLSVIRSKVLISMRTKRAVAAPKAIKTAALVRAAVTVPSRHRVDARPTSAAVTAISRRFRRRVHRELHPPPVVRACHRFVIVTAAPRVGVRT